MKKSLIITLMMAASMMANAQGFNEISLKYAPLRSTVKLYDEKESGSDTGIELEFNNHFRVKKDSPLYLSLGIGMQYAWASGSGDAFGVDVEGEESILVGRIPVGLMYHYDLSETYAIEALAGLDVSYYMMCSTKMYGKSYDFADTDGFNRFNAGWHCGINAVFCKAFVVGIGFQKDFTKYFENIIEAKASKLELKVGYRF